MNSKQQNDRNERESVVSSFMAFPDEIAHLTTINKKIDIALQEANDNVKRIDQEYMDAKRYMVDFRGEIDPHEMFQNELALKRIDSTGAFATSIWEKLVKLKDSPYFARIDFRMNDDNIADTYYIGRFDFTHENELLIFDWRAPIASMFYDYEVGLAGYMAPIGMIEGELTLKRQFKIKRGILEYALESAINIQDDVLQRELSHNSDEKMKSIIATIQKEQNQIIRNDKAKTIIIQGVAGSGKTSIALHRVAFLLYRFKDKLSAQDVTILSPNRVFGDYIASVLPELGEEPINELSFWDIADTQLSGTISFERDNDPLEITEIKYCERVSFKSTLDFVKQMDKYIAELPTFVFKATNYSFGRFSVTADWIQGRFMDYKSYPIKKRIAFIADDIYNRFMTDNYMNDEIPQVNSILKNLNKMLTIKNTTALYKRFYQWLERPEMLLIPKKDTLEWADVFPYLYLYGAFEGLKDSKLVKHLIIDEMQDYTPIQYAVINQLFSCQKTIIGDFGQCINPNHLHTLEQLQIIYNDASLVELNKSYRSTYEIIIFARDIGKIEKLEPIERHGEEPTVIACTDTIEEVNKIKETISSFLAGKSASLGIILKTNNEAKKLFDILKHDYPIKLVSPDSTHFASGISITSIQMSKGLEFDEVVIPDVDENTYQTEYDRGLLYIACTRAMNKLTIFYVQKPSQFLPK